MARVPHAWSPHIWLGRLAKACQIGLFVKPLLDDSDGRRWLLLAAGSTGSIDFGAESRRAKGHTDLHNTTHNFWKGLPAKALM